MSRRSPSAVRSPYPLRRWLRLAWLDRLPQLTEWLVGRLTGRDKTADHLREGRRPFKPEIVQFEPRFIPNDMLGVLTAGPIFGGLALTGGFTTPAMALLRGFGPKLPAPAPPAPAPGAAPTQSRAPCSRCRC